MKGRRSTAAAIGMLLGVALGLGCAPGASAQAAGGVTRALGTVTAIQSSTITLKTDAGAEVSVTVGDSTRMLRIEPGQKTLEGAAPVRLADLQVGDRILAAGKAPEGGGPVAASMVVLMKHTDILQRQHQEQADWQKRGVGGLVRSVDAAAGTITLATGAGRTARVLAVRVSKSTVIRRYASNSIKFADAKPGTFDQIQPGDQLEALGNRSADGRELTAEEIVSGSFRNIAGTISSIDSAANQITVTDLKTKQPVTVKITADSQVRKLPEMMAQMIAMRLKGAPGSPPGASPVGGAPAGTPAAAAAERPAGQSHWGGAPGADGTAGGNGGPPSFQQMLSHLPPATLADLSKGEAVMIVATEGASANAATAVTLLGGVEPILTAAPAGSEESILSPWSLSAPSGGDAAGGNQ